MYYFCPLFTFACPLGSEDKDLSVAALEFMSMGPGHTQKSWKLSVKTSILLVNSFESPKEIAKKEDDRHKQIVGLRRRQDDNQTTTQERDNKDLTRFDNLTYVPGID